MGQYGEKTEISCPVSGCSYQKKFSEPSRVRHHFHYSHMEHTFCISKQGMVPRCALCGLTGQSVDTERHRNTKTCALDTPRYQAYLRHLSEKDSRRVRFKVGEAEIDRVTQFKYLGRTLSDVDDDAAAVEDNLKKATTRWAMHKKLLRREGASPRVMGHFYKAIVQAVLLYGAESWVLTPQLITKLRTFHRKAARFITNRHIRPKADESGAWVYPDSASVLEDAGLFEIETYIQRRRDTIFHNYV